MIIKGYDKNEAWQISGAGKKYPGIGKPATAFMYEKWMIKEGKVYYFISTMPNHKKIKTRMSSINLLKSTEKVYM